MSDATSKDKIIKMLSDYDEMTLSIALSYATNYKQYGVDVTQTWLTATQQASALEKAYRDGYCEGQKAARRCS